MHPGFSQAPHWNREPLARSLMTEALAGIARHWHLRVDTDAPAPGPRAPQLVVTLERR